MKKGVLEIRNALDSYFAQPESAKDYDESEKLEWKDDSSEITMEFSIEELEFVIHI